MQKQDDDEEINEAKIKNQDILTEEEILNILDMSVYQERIENIIGKNYSYLFFDYFDSIYHSKIKAKISSPLTNFLNKSNKNNDSLWMFVYKSIKIYSKDNLPILITKYFKLKAEIEYKFIYNESKKYTNYPYKFIDIYIKKMKKINQKKLNELKAKHLENSNIFDCHSKSVIMRSFMSKKKYISSKRLFIKNDYSINNEEQHSDSSTKEEEIKHKKQMRTEIMKQVRQLKIKSIKEIQKLNNIQNKQKQKYGGVKSRLLDAYNEHQKYIKLLNFIPNRNVSFNKYNNSRYKEEVIFPSSQRKKSPNNNSRISYYNNSNKNSKYINDEKINNFYYMNTQTSYNTKERNSLKNSINEFLKSNRNNLKGSKNSINKNKTSLFTTLDAINKKKTKKINKSTNLFSFYHQNKKNSNIFKLTDNYAHSFIKRPKSNISYKKGKNYDTKSFINKLEKKRNKEFLENLLYRSANKNDFNYSNKLYELFKKTECF